MHPSLRSRVAVNSSALLPTLRIPLHPCRLRQKGLRDAWVRLEPAARQLAEGEGAPPATLEDWVWANSLFW